MLEEHKEYLKTHRPPNFGPALPEDILDEFLTAVEADCCEAVEALLDEYFPDRSSTQPGRYKIFELSRVLREAAIRGRTRIMETLLRYPFPADTLQRMASVALCYRHKDTVRCMVDQGWDINHTFGATGWTILASSVRAPERARILLELGADPNHRPCVDRTAMSMAAQRSPPEYIAELIDRWGGDVHRGQVLHHALDRSTLDRSSVDRSTLDDRTVNVAGLEYKTAEDIVDVLRLLLDRGAPLNLTMYADDPPSLRMYGLRDLGTPLHKASQQGNVEAVRFLLSQGADASVCSTKGKTALEWAEAAGHDDVVAILRCPDHSNL